MAREKGPPDILITPGAEEVRTDPWAAISELKAALEQQIRTLDGRLDQVAQMSSIECILTNGFVSMSDGFGDISAKLGALEDLTPQRVPLAKAENLVDGDRRLHRLTSATARPNWFGATSVAIRTVPVFFIGEKAPPEADKGSYAS